MKSRTKDETNRAARVTGATRPKQAADIRTRWGWVEPSVWTERMLTRLEQSEPTTVWFGLGDKVLSERNLQAAFWAVWRNEGAPGVDGQTVRQFDAHAERDFAESSYGFRPGRGGREAVARVEELLSEGFDFLGWHFRGGKKWPRKKSLQKLQEKLRPLTKRCNGRSLSEIIAKANPILRGWHGYFRESHWTGLSGPDGWLRRRLRALLRQREKRPGYGRSQADSRRWPNRWFAAQGLFSLEHGSCAYG